MEIGQAVNKRKKITRLLLILLMILLSLGCIKYLISKSSKYISENGKSSMGAVVEQIQQTYDLQVSALLYAVHKNGEGVFIAGMREDFTCFTYGNPHDIVDFAYIRV